MRQLRRPPLADRSSRLERSIDQQSEVFLKQKLSICETFEHVKSLTGHSWWTRFCKEIDDVTLLNSTVRQIHLEPQAVARSRLKIHDQRASCRVAFRHFEHTRVLLAGVALINRAINVDIFIFRIWNAAPDDLNACRLNLRNVHNRLKAIRVDLLVGGDFEPFTDAQLRTMTRKRNVEESNLVGCFRFKIIQCVGR